MCVRSFVRSFLSFFLDIDLLPPPLPSTCLFVTSVSVPLLAISFSTALIAWSSGNPSAADCRCIARTTTGCRLDWTQQIVQEGPCPVLSCWWVVPRSCRIGSPEDPRRNPSVRTRHQMLLQRVFFWRRTAPDLHRSSISPFLEDDVKAAVPVRSLVEEKSVQGTARASAFSYRD